MAREHFYRPSERGFEREIKKRLDYWAKLREKKQRSRLSRRFDRSLAKRGGVERPCLLGKPIE